VIPANDSKTDFAGEQKTNFQAGLAST